MLYAPAVRAGRVLRIASVTSLVALAGVVTGLAACGSDPKDRTYEDTSPVEPAPPEDLGSSGSIGSGTPDASTADASKCAAEVTTAHRAEVDIILVIDNSGSMSEETSQVKSNINKFAAKIGSSGLDYTVVMIGGTPQAFPFPFPGFPSPPGICVPPPLGHATCGQHNPPKFHHVNTPVGSKNSLEIILEKYGTYAPWLRSSAFKVFIEVTDDNSSMGYAEFDKKLLAKSAAQFGTAAGRRYIFNSICGWKTGTALLSGNECNSAVNTGDQYQQLSKLTGGIVDSVCIQSYAGVFDNIAKGLVTKIGCEFAFPKSTSTTGQQTDPTKVAVTFTPGGGAAKTLTQVTDASKCGAVADAWYYDNNTTPTKILFCPTTCTGAGSDTEGKLEIAVGCVAPAPK